MRGAPVPVTGPRGREGCSHESDAREPLRMHAAEAMDVVVRLKDLAAPEPVRHSLAAKLETPAAKEGRPMLEVHDWKAPSPFADIAGMST
ncbi:MAG: hypothetical protein C0505_16935 [Leptothrix sp. (in: Bacteria)]|nr:hypothetical protein [Leptothrix sp. (in: b-proteobacteria)]